MEGISRGYDLVVRAPQYLSHCVVLPITLGTAWANFIESFDDRI